MGFALWGDGMSERRTVAETAEYDAARNSALQVRLFRHWITVVCLAVADVAAFALRAECSAVGHMVPRLLFYRSFLQINTPIDVFYIFGVIFIAVRYVCGDYSRRQLFWDGARASTIGLIVAALPDVLLFSMFPQQYSFFAVAGSWIFLFVSIPLFRQGARWGMTYAGLWRLPTALIASGSRADSVHVRYLVARLRISAGSFSTGMIVSHRKSSSI